MGLTKFVKQLEQDMRKFLYFHMSHDKQEKTLNFENQLHTFLKAGFSLKKLF